jgi:hypothetical protein
MHQTTIRFASAAWRSIEEQAPRNGVSAAPYLDEAAVER